MHHEIINFQVYIEIQFFNQWNYCKPFNVLSCDQSDDIFLRTLLSVAQSTERSTETRLNEKKKKRKQREWRVESRGGVSTIPQSRMKRIAEQRDDKEAL